MFKFGDLVKTNDGYYAIVLFVEGGEAGVFLGNGMVTVYEPGHLEHCPGNVEVSSFVGILNLPDGTGVHRWVMDPAPVKEGSL